MYNLKKLPELSIFFPFWNEEKNIEKVIKLAVPVAEKIADKWEILMIDDGSSDKTLGIARKLARRNKNLKAIAHKPNRGYGAALREGFENAQYKYVIFTDGDGQFKFSEIYQFLEKIKNADIVMGYREERKDNPFRHLLMNLLRVWDLILFGIHFKDIDCGFKMFRKSALEKIMPFKSEGAMITTEILARARKANLRFAEVKVSHLPRKYGDQSGGNLRVIVRAIGESFILWSDLRNGRT